MNPLVSLITNLRPVYSMIEYIIEYFFNCVVIEGRHACEKFINHHTETPPINHLVMRIAVNDLWGNIIWSSYNPHSPVCVLK